MTRLCIDLRKVVDGKARIYLLHVQLYLFKIRYFFFDYIHHLEACVPYRFVGCL